MVKGLVTPPGADQWRCGGRCRCHRVCWRGPGATSFQCDSVADAVLEQLRISYKAVGRLRSYAAHDWIVARRLEKLAGKIDLVHAWPLGALRTLRTARRLGIATVLERPNAHTRFAYEVVQKECARIGVPLPPGHEHAYNAVVLEREEVEYQLADRLLCPSDFVLRTFMTGDSPVKNWRDISTDSMKNALMPTERASATMGS